MEFATHWDAVFNPQRAEGYFDRAGEIRFDPATRDFSCANAWWLAEMSRWIYRQEGTDGDPRARAHAHLARAGLREVACLHHGGTHAALLEATQPQHADPFAVLVFRGSSGPRNWLDNALAFAARDGSHYGYRHALERIWQRIDGALAQVSVPLFVTGHSLGGALAGLAAARLPAVAAYSFGAPAAAARNGTQPAACCYRVVNFRDLAAGVARRSRFHHIGELVYLSRTTSLWRNPTPAAVETDLAQGVRNLTWRLNRQRRLVLPEGITDHAPINYVAHMERHALRAKPAS